MPFDSHCHFSVSSRRMDAIVVEELAVVRGGRLVLDGVSLTVPAGLVTGLLGPSGSGKTTLMRSIVGVQQVAGGTVEVFGEPAGAAPLRSRIGYVTQDPSVYDDLTVAENLDVPLDYRGVKKSERASRVADVLDRFAMVGKKDLYPRQLSGGQQQLVGIARAVIAEPSLILADEPTGNLHSAQGREIMELFTRLNREGTTIVQVTHSEANAAYGHRIIELADGWVTGEQAAA